MSLLSVGTVCAVAAVEIDRIHFLARWHKAQTPLDHDDDDEIAYFTVCWKTRASFVYRTKNMR